MIDTASVIKVSIVEDDDLLRGHLTALIGGADGFCCMGAHRSAEAALKHIPAEKPHVVLQDLELPNKSGLECISELKAQMPKVEFLVLTIHADTDRIFPALQAGACGYLLKPVPPARLLEAIADARAGGAPMSSQIARKVIKTFQERAEARETVEALTARENQVLRLFAQGHEAKEIAELLQISPRTIGTHLHNTYEKLQVRSRAAAVAKLLRSSDIDGLPRDPEDTDLPPERR